MTVTFIFVEFELLNGKNMKYKEFWCKKWQEDFFLQKTIFQTLNFFKK